MSNMNKQVDFWSSNPCGSYGNFEDVRSHRFVMEPYLQKVLKGLQKPNTRYLEVGCGQGIDAITICDGLDKTSSYHGIDYSVKSVNEAQAHLEHFIKNVDIKVKPIFKVGNALNLDFPNSQFDFVYSMGVLHHTPDIKKSINEIHRVLNINGEATIFLYRSGSLKVETAKFLRRVQKILDKVFKRERIIFQFLNNKKSTIFGTMFLECFGVPILNSYNKKEIQKMFSQFSKLSYQPYGYNIHFLNQKNDNGRNRFGYYWKIDLKK